MKSTLFHISFLLFAIYTNNLFCSAAEAPEPVLDAAGEHLRKGINYYVQPYIFALGGGLTLASTGNETCPLDVVQDPFEVNPGLPLTFSPVNPKKGVIRVATDLNIKFNVSTICVQSTVWKLDDYDESTGQYFITTGGVEGNPGIDTISNWFKIEKYGSHFYKLVYCPTVCKFCKVICSDVGIFFQDGKRRLALSDDPFIVVFMKAETGTLVMK